MNQWQKEPATGWEGGGGGGGGGGRIKRMMGGDMEETAGVKGREWWVKRI